MPINDIDEKGLFGCENCQGVEFNELETEPLIEEQGGDIKDNVGEVESNLIYVDRVFGDEEEAYEDQNSYALLKGFGVCKSKTSKSITDHKVI